MSITISELRHDTHYFFSKQIRNILFISIAVTFISIIIDMLIQPDMHIMSIIEDKNFINSNSFLDLINNMNQEEKFELLKYSILKIIILLMSKTLLLGGIITLIISLSNNKQESISFSICSLYKFLPSIFLLNCFTTFIIQLGFMFLIIPGILLSILLALAPIIFSFKKHSLIDSIYSSIYISWKYINIIGPSVLFWMLGRFILTTMLSNLYFINKNIIVLILNIGMNMLFSFLIVYLFRFYMLFLRS